MRLLMIATGYPPYLFSENLCNGKLVMALLQAGIEVDVISRIDEGPSYGTDWTEPWNMLKPTAHTITYESGNRIQQFADVVYSGLIMGGSFVPGVRWMRRAYEKAVELISTNQYDAILTRSPNDTAHFIGEKLKKKTGIKWIANWNDPAAPIWPGLYKHDYTAKEQKRKMIETARLLKSADINTFPSDSLRQHFVTFFPFLKKQKTIAIPHIGLCQNFWPLSVQRTNDCKLKLLHSGNLSVERNPETTFQALRYVIDSGFTSLEFHIMGHINDYTSQLIKKYSLQDYVKCIGSFSYMEALSKMQTYDILVLLEARLEKGIFFASKFTDYLQTGLPILAISQANGFAVDMLLNQEGEFLADNQSVDSIVSSLNKIIARWEKGVLADCASKKLYEKVSPEAVVKLYKTLI